VLIQDGVDYEVISREMITETIPEKEDPPTPEQTVTLTHVTLRKEQNKFAKMNRFVKIGKFLTQ
jgi:hypothetical protein